MTEGGHGAEPLTPEEEAAVAAMLAQAGGPVRMPDDVAARLDDVLAGLQEERSAQRGADVVELRARRRWPRLLVAAAAVVVGGYAVGTVATQGTLSGTDEGMSAASDAEAGSGAGSGAGSDAGDVAGSEALEEPGAEDQDESGGSSREGSPESTQSAPQSESGSSAEMMVSDVRLRSDRLDTGVRRALRVLDGSTDRTGLTSDVDAVCPAPELGKRQRSLSVRYDGEAAVLVAGPERRGTVEVTVWSCAGEELASTLVRP